MNHDTQTSLYACFPQAAETRRLGAEAQLQGPGGFPQLRQLHAALVARRNRMMVELGRIYQVGTRAKALAQVGRAFLVLGQERMAFFMTSAT